MQRRAAKVSVYIKKAILLKMVDNVKREKQSFKVQEHFTLHSSVSIMAHLVFR